MWTQITGALWRIVRVAEETERNRQNLKELEKQYRDFTAATERKFHDLEMVNERLVHELQRLNDELKRQREHEESERRILKLELENYLLRQQRELPSVEPKQLSEPATGNLKDDAEDGK